MHHNKTVFACKLGSGEFINCNIYSNTSHGLWFEQHRYGIVENCNIYGNAGAGIYNNQYTLTVKNCIIANNDIGIEEVNASYEVESTYNCFYNNGTNFWDENSTALDTAVAINTATDCSNNIVADPLFVDAPDDFHITGNSPCYNAGTPTTTIATDLYGNPRLDGSAVDIGSHEWQAPAGTVIMIQ